MPGHSTCEAGWFSAGRLTLERNKAAYACKLLNISESCRDIKYQPANSHWKLKPQHFTWQPYQSSALVSFNAFTYSDQQTINLPVADCGFPTCYRERNVAVQDMQNCCFA